MVPLLTSVDIHAKPGGGYRRAAERLLPKLRQCLQKFGESLWAEVVLGRSAHLHTDGGGASNIGIGKYFAGLVQFFAGISAFLSVY